jgi:hypothetical protein
MTLNEFDTLSLVETLTSDSKEEFSIPLCMNDIISICKDFTSLGWQIQNQIENILEIGLEESIKSEYVKQESLPHIKFFLQQVINNPYFGEAGNQSQDCLDLIKQYEYKYKVNYVATSN